MHHLPKMFVLRKQSKKMDQMQSPRQADQTPSPRRLVRSNAAKNFEYTPPPSAASSASTSTSSAAPRSGSLGSSYYVDQTSIRIEGNAEEFDLICQSLGVSVEDFEIPKAVYETMKSKSSSDIIQQMKKNPWDFDEPEDPQQQAALRVVDNLSNRLHDGLLMSQAFEVREENSESKHCGAAFVHNSSGVGGKSEGIKGDRPPSLTPPPLRSLPILENGCSTWDRSGGSAPDDDRGSGFCHEFSSFSKHGEEGNGDNADGEGLTGVRMGETDFLSGSCSFMTTNDDGSSSRNREIGEAAIPSSSCSFTTTNDDDSSSTTTEPVSIISPNARLRANITFWEKGAKLGKGSFGTVYEAFSGDGFFFAVKEVSLLEQGGQGRESIYQLEQEIEFLSQSDHENIVRYLGTDKDESNLYIFLELVSQGSLLDLYHKYRLRDSQVSAYTRQILLGLKYLHDRDVVHRDIKCANILVASSGTVKLADFGLAKATRLNDLKSCKGTAFWMAPEVVYRKRQGYGRAADIWSLGCTVLEMLTRHVPYYPLEFTQALYRIGMAEPPSVPDTLSRGARDFINQCLHVNPEDRPSAAELLEHPFVQRQTPTPLGTESPLFRGRQF